MVGFSNNYLNILLFFGLEFWHAVKNMISVNLRVFNVSTTVVSDFMLVL